MLLQPRDGPLIPAAGVAVVPEMMVDRGHQEPIGCVSTFVQIHRSPKRGRSRLPVAGAIIRDPQRTPGVRPVGSQSTACLAIRTALATSPDRRRLAHEVPRQTAERADQCFAEAWQGGRLIADERVSDFDARWIEPSASVESIGSASKLACSRRVSIRPVRSQMVGKRVASSS